MMVSPGLAMLFLLRSSNAELCPESCKCTSTSQGMAINCSFRGLQEIPFIPETTTELYLHNNFLTTVAPGTFDKLQSLRNVSLHNNVWNCDCHIAYLKQWLQSPPAMVHPNVTCFTPTSIRMKLVAKLRGNEYSSCRSHNQYRCQDLYFESIALCLLYLLLLILIMYSLTCVKSIPYIFTPNIGFNEFELTPLIKRSLVRCLQDERIWELTELESSIEWTSDILIEKPFPCESMEILPQVLSTLRSKHNIKIKLH